MHTHIHTFSVRLAVVLLSGALLLLGLGLGCPPPRHADNFDDDAGNLDDDDDATGDDDDFDNVAYCYEVADALDCGDTDFEAIMNCDQFDAVLCDIADYFDCLEDEAFCDGGVADLSGWADCAPLVEC